MDLFLHLFVPKSGVLQKNKGVKWKTLQEKVIIVGVLTKTQFDSRVEDLARKLRVIDEELAGIVMAPLASKEDDTTT
jgi:predicted ATP-dependent Lon-type protease